MGTTDAPQALYLVLTLISVICSGLASGLTQGLLSLSPLEVNVKCRSSYSHSHSTAEQQQAAAVLPLIAHRHLLLVTIMLFNAIANEALPLFLSHLVSPWASIVLSVSLVLIIGEIIPAAVFTGKYQLYIASTLSPFVWLLIVVLFPVAYPISKCLDALLGAELGLTLFSRNEIYTMIQIQEEEGHRHRQLEGSSSTTDAVHRDEVAVIGGLFSLRSATAKEAMTACANVFALHIDQRLSLKTLSQIFNTGYSRIPIYENNLNDVVGILLVKDLLFIDPEDEVSIRNFMKLFGRAVPSVWLDSTLNEVRQFVSYQQSSINVVTVVGVWSMYGATTQILLTFKASHCLMALVMEVNNCGLQDPFYELMGIITMEDIIEELLGSDITDETDPESRLRKKIVTRNIDFAQLKDLAPLGGSPNATNLYDESIGAHQTRLSEDEVNHVATVLRSKYPQLTEIYSTGNCQYNLQNVVRQSRVLDVHAKVPSPAVLPNTVIEEKDESAATDSYLAMHRMYLYSHSKVTNACTFILQGQLGVLTGSSEAGFVGPDSVLGIEALLEGMFCPQYSAYIASDHLRCLRILHPQLEVPRPRGVCASAESADSVNCNPTTGLQALKTRPLLTNSIGGSDEQPVSENTKLLPRTRGYGSSAKLHTASDK